MTNTCTTESKELRNDDNDDPVRDLEYCNRFRRCWKSNNGGDSSIPLEDPESMVTCLRPMLPKRKVSWNSRFGWDYRPTASVQDRLGMLGNEKLPSRTTAAAATTTTTTTAAAAAAAATTTTTTTTTTAAATDPVWSPEGDSFGPLKKRVHETTTRATPMSETSTVVTTSTAGEGKTISSVPKLAPKAALYEWYGKKPRKRQLQTAQYKTWDNGKQSNDLLFTSIFVCPITQEAFLAGPWSDSYVVSDCGLYWYPRKIMAEHAAAARAYDCWRMRDPASFTANHKALGQADPYWPSQQPPWPESIPPRIATELQRNASKRKHQDAPETEDRSKRKKHNDVDRPELTKPPLIEGGLPHTTNNYPQQHQPDYWKHPSQVYRAQDKPSASIEGRPPHNYQDSRVHRPDYWKNPQIREAELYRAQRLPRGNNQYWYYPPPPPPPPPPPRP